MHRVLTLAVVMLTSIVAGMRGDGHTQQPPTAEQGRRIVHASCETCHSLAPGQVKSAPSLYGELNGPHPRATRAQAEHVILHGRNKMPAYADVFSAEETDSILLYLRQIP